MSLQAPLALGSLLQNLVYSYNGSSVESPESKL